jgi:hypothetical protein
MDTWAITRLIDWAAGKDGNEKTKTKLRDELCSVADELAGPSPSPIERVLADVAATSWLAYRMHEAHYAACVTADRLTIAQSAHALRRQDGAHRRLVSTLRTLASVRRLAVPSVQINVARQQQIAQLNGGAHEGGR